MLIFSIHSSWLVFSIMVCLGANFFSAVRLDCAIKEYSTSLWNTLRLFLIGSFVGIALPSSLGNDFYFIYYLKKQSCSLSKATTLIFLQRIFGLLLFLFIGIIYIIAKYKTASAMLGHFQLSTNNLLLYVIYGFIVVTVFGMFLLYSYPKYFNWLKSQWFNNQIWHTIQTISKKTYCQLIIYTILYQLFAVIGFYIAIRALNQNVRIFDLLFISSFVAFASLLPISVSALGVAESVIVVCFVSLGMDINMAILIAFINRLLTWLPAFIGGIFFMKAPTLRNIQTKSFNIY